MRRIVLSLGVAGAVALAGVARAAASDRSGNKTLELTGRETQAAQMLAEGFVGSRFVGADNLFTGTRKVGNGGKSCEVLVPGAGTATFQCLITLTLPHGSLTLQSMPTLTEEGLDRFESAVTGGTGDYRHARGEALVEELTPTETRYTIDLR
jgi:uncharacterized low-complexity protein